MNKNLTGSLYIIASAIFFGTYGIWSKLMSSSFGEFNQAWIRALILLAILIPVGLLSRSFRKISRSDLKWFAIISLCGGFNQAPYFFGFKHLPVGTATLLFYLMLTVGAYVIGRLFFNETITKVKYAALGLAVAGLFIIYRFSLSSDQVIPALLTMLAGLMGSGAVVFSKKLSSGYSETQILTGIMLSMFAVNVPLSLAFGESVPSFAMVTPWFAEVVYSLALLTANAFVIAGFKYLEPSIGGVLGLLEVVFAALFGIILFGEGVNLQFIAGSSLLLISASLSDLVQIFKRYSHQYPSSAS